MLCERERESSSTIIRCNPGRFEMICDRFPYSILEEVNTPLIRIPGIG
jgi:hypothetical protein